MKDAHLRDEWKKGLNPRHVRAACLPIIDENRLKKDLRQLTKKYKNPQTYRTACLNHIRTYYAEGRAWLEQNLRAKKDGAIYVSTHAHIIDVMLGCLTHIVVPNLLNTKAEFAIPKFAIMAVGGYGRGELAPYSDIDLLFVQPDQTPDKSPDEKHGIKAILYMLWDLGLKVGYASRTSDENLSAAAQDMTICTSCLDMRFVAGNKKLGDQIQRAFIGWMKQQSIADFTTQKLQERDFRHKRTGGTRYAVEPNIKDGKGGLRDLHTLFWIAKYAYRLRSIDDIIDTGSGGDSGILRLAEARSFAQSQRFLWTVRCFLHLYHGRASEGLSFDAQRAIAPQMQFRPRHGLRDVERFMKRYYMAARQVGNLTRIFCAALESDFAHHPPLQPSLSLNQWGGQDKLEPFILRHGRLALPENRGANIDVNLGANLAQNAPRKNDRNHIIKLFLLAQDHQLNIHPDSLRQVTRDVRRAKTSDLQTPETHAMFLHILTHKHNPARLLRLMNESGWLGKYLPDFGRITSMMQFDMYHSWTVDEHTIKAVSFMHDIEEGKLKQIAPVASQLIHEVGSRRALYVAIFLHDLAKGRGGDHSMLGGELARAICPMLGLDEETSETVIWLVQNHLLMSTTAFRYDLHDPQTISDFCAIMQSPERLKLLLILTVADILAVGPEIWNGWKASLMRDLYHRAEAYLGGAAPADVAQQAVMDAQMALRERLDGEERRFEKFAEKFYPSYWTNFSTESHLRHVPLVERFCQKFDAQEGGGPNGGGGEEDSGVGGGEGNGENGEGEDKLLIDFTVDDKKTSTIMLVMAQDYPGLFSHIAGAVALAGCSVMHARINTRHDGTILDQLRIQTTKNQPVTDKVQQQKITQLIKNSLQGHISLYDKLQEKAAGRSKRLKALDTPPRVILSNGRSQTHSVIEINGGDRLGLLYQITACLAELGLQINSATISTYGESVVDVFYVKDIYGMRIENETTQIHIQKTVLDMLTKNTAPKRLLIKKHA